MSELTGYELSRDFWDFTFENPEITKPIHAAIYFFAVEHHNRLGKKDKFGFPSQMVMEAIGVKNWRTYSSGLSDLVDFGFIKMIETSKNQYSSNIIAIVKNTKAHTKALDKALSKHSTKHSQGTVSIDKQLNKETKNKEGDSKESIDNFLLLEYLNKQVNRKYKVVTSKAARQIKARIKDGYTKADFVKVIKSASTDPFHLELGLKNITLEFITRPEKFERFLNMAEPSTKYNPNL